MQFCLGIQYMSSTDISGHVSDSEPPVTRRRSGIYTTAPRPVSSRTSPSPPATPIPTDPEITVLHAPLACVGFSKQSQVACDERLRKYIVWPKRSMDEWAQQALDRLESDGEHEDEPTMPLLLNEDAVRRERESERRPFISYTRTQDGASLVTEVKALLGMFPDDDLERLDVQCATGELSSFDDSLYDDIEDDEDDGDDNDDRKGVQDIHNDDDNHDKLAIDRGGSFHDTPPMLDITQISTLTSLMGAPPTPPISTAGESSATSSPTKKRLSLPFALSPPMLSPDSTTSTNEIQISWSSNRPTTRSMSKSFSTLGTTGLDLPPVRTGIEGEGRGMKKCLQLDLRAMSESTLSPHYNLGTSHLLNGQSPCYMSARPSILCFTITPFILDFLHRT